MSFFISCGSVVFDEFVLSMISSFFLMYDMKWMIEKLVKCVIVLSMMSMNMIDVR